MLLVLVVRLVFRYAYVDSTIGAAVQPAYSKVSVMGPSK